MSTTPSPSKRARLPTTSAVPSATASPFPSSAAANNARGPRSVGPTGTSSSAPHIVGLGMSPNDAAFSPVPNAEMYGMSGFTPYNTTSPAYTAGGGATGMSAASPISAALAHGSRVLSNIQPSPFYQNGTPMMQQQPYMGRYPNSSQGGMMMQPPNGMMMQQQQQLHQQQQQLQAKTSAVPQPGSPEYLKSTLQHLQNTLLSRLESESQAFFDAADSALSISADSRVVANKASNFQSALQNVLTYLEKNGLASIPLLPDSSSPPAPQNDTHATLVSPTPNAPTDNTTNPPQSATTAATTTTDTTTAPTTAASAATATSTTESGTNGAGGGGSDLHTASLEAEIKSLQQQAKDLFDRRQRLKESASIVSGILDS